MKNNRVMLVDDDNDVLFSSRRLLELHGYNVSCYKNGLEALHAFESDPMGFDIVITDMTMPKMTGYELSKKILVSRKGLPIFLCTGFNESISKKDAMELGIFKFIQKPVNMKDLIQIFREKLD